MTGLKLLVLLLQLYENVLVVRRDLKKWSLKDIKLSTGRVPFPSKVLKTLVLLRVLSAGMNNTEINTRVGWYSDSVTRATSDTAKSEVREAEVRIDGGWNETTPFPFIQGTDCCGRVAEIGPGGDPELLGKRVLVRSCIRPEGFESMENLWMGSDFDGAFAQYVKVPQSEVFVLECDWSDAELATIPCAYGTAENMIQRSGITSGERVLITGASGGVGSAALQLVKW